MLRAVRTYDAGRGLFRASEDLFDLIWPIFVKPGDQIAAVVHRDTGTGVQNRIDVGIIAFRTLPFYSKRGDALVAY